MKNRKLLHSRILLAFAVAVMVSAPAWCQVTVPSAAAPPSANSVRAHLGRAFQLLREGKWREAVSECEKAEAAATKPAEKVDAILAKARALWTGQHYRESAKEFRRAAQIGGAREAQRLEAWRGAMRAAQAAGDRKAESQAIEALLKFPHISDAEKARLTARLGQLCLLQGDKDRAIALFQEVAKRYPREYGATIARRQLLSALIRAGKNEEVFKMLKTAREENWPDAEDLHVRAAQLFSLNDAPQAALRVYEELLKWRPESEAGWRGAWHVFRQQGQEQRLIDQALAVASINKKAAQAIAGLAETMGLDENPALQQKALSMYQRLLQILPDDRRLLRGGARLALRLGKIDKADAWSRRLLEIAPQDVSALLVRAQVLAKKGDMAAALEMVEKAARFDPRDISSAQRLASLLAQAGLYDRLPEIVAQARKATGNSSALASELARFYARQCKWDAAVDELVKAVAAGEASPRYAHLIVRSWMSDITALGEINAALVRRYRSGQLPQQMLSALLYGLVTAGDVRAARKLLDEMPQEKAREAAAEVLKWSIGVTGEGRKLLYEVALGGRMAPTTEAQLALTLADDFAAAGQWQRAAQVLLQHHKPGLPTPLAREYEVRMSEALVRAGDAESARRVAQKWAIMGDVRAMVVMAECALAEGDYDEAERWAKRALASSKATQRTSRYGVGMLWGAMGTAESTEARGRAMFICAECLLRRGLLDDATRAFRRVIEEMPQTEAATAAVERIALVGMIAQLNEEDRKEIIEGLKALDRGALHEAERRLRSWLEAGGELGAHLELMVAEALSRRDRTAAIERFEEIAAHYPDTSVAPYALYLAARMLAPQKPAEARRLAEQVINQYADSAIAPLCEQLAEQIEMAPSALP